MADKSEPATLPMRTVLQAAGVVALGRAENVLQLPSPIYTSAFIDAHHVLIGAGGGGRRFGMPNIALLLRVQSLPKADAAAAAAPSPAAPTPVWAFAAAVDFGPDDIPWCTSTFLPLELPGSGSSGGATPSLQPPSSSSSTDPAALDWSAGQRRVLEGLVGLVALSSITSFSLVGVYRGAEPTDVSCTSSSPAAATTDARRYLRQLARIEVPHDVKNPDKKPIALAQNLLLVSHDDNGVVAYTLTDLVPDTFEDEDGEAYAAKYAAQVERGATLQRRVPQVRTEARPVAVWSLPARINDLSVNRVCLVQAEAAHVTTPASPHQPCKARLQEHLVVAALLLDKTLVLSTLRLRRRYTSARAHKRAAAVANAAAGDGDGKMTPVKSVAPGPGPTAALAMTTALTVTGAALPLPFKLLTSSLRLVRLFGWADIGAAQQADMRRRLTWQSLQEGGALTQGALCSVLVVAYNAAANQTYMIHGTLDVSGADGAVPAVAAGGGGGGSGTELSLQVRWSRRDPAPVLSDAITSLAVCTDGPAADYAARVAANPLGLAIPTHWIAGTVEGWVASLRLRPDAQPPHAVQWFAEQVRPAASKSVAKRFPALHKEPVSCVAVSAENDVVSADIAQNVALTVLPYVVPSASPGPGNAVAQPRSSTASALFPPLRGGGGVAGGGLLGLLMSEVGNGPVSMRVAWFLLIPLVLALTGVIIRMGR